MIRKLDSFTKYLKGKGNSIQGQPALNYDYRQLTVFLSLRGTERERENGEKTGKVETHGCVFLTKNITHSKQQRTKLILQRKEMKMGSKRARNDKSYTRKSSGLKSRKFLIVCQGRGTEKNYFKALRKHYRQEGMDIKVEPKNPSEMLQFAGKYCSYENIRYSEVWLVFDRDNTPSDEFNKVVNKKMDKRDYEAAFSNPCFELWICLHFEQIDCNLEPNKCQKKTKELFKNHVNREYKKNDEEIFDTLKDKMKNAITNAEKLYMKFKDTLPSEANPCTTVHLLVKSLEKKIRTSCI